MVPEPGVHLGIYRLTQRLGAGGMGEVWKAEDTRLHRNVAIKLLPAAMTGDTESRARLLREARTAGQLYHPNIATIHAIELDGEAPYIVMEYVEGESLTHAIGARRLTEMQIAEMGRGIADALAEAHAKGIIHRDIKPDNVVLSGSRVKVLDFGIAKRYGDSAETPPGEIVTEAGVVLGTVSYMSPEQATGRPLDGRSDIFSLGVMLFQALAGQLPFRGTSNLETLKQILRSDPPELGAIASTVSQEMAAIVRRCLRKPLEERYQSADELARDLGRIALRGFVETPPHPRSIAVQTSANSEAITMVQPVPAAPRSPAPAADLAPAQPLARTVEAPRPASAGLSRPAVSVPASALPSAVTPPPAVPEAIPAPPVATPSAAPAAGFSSTAPGIEPGTVPAPPPAASYTQWIVAGASFIVVLAIAGGFLVAKLLEPKSENQLAPAEASLDTAMSQQTASSSPAVAVPATQPSQQAAPPATAKPPADSPAAAAPTRPQLRAKPDLKVAAASATTPPSTSSTAAARNASYRAAMDSLEGAGWRHLDDQGRMTAGAEAAEPLFAEALEAEPDNVSAQLHLAVIRLFRRRYEVAQKAIHPLLASERLSYSERAIASYSFSASAVAPSGAGTAEFESALDQALAHYGNDPQFVAFARDARWLVKRGKLR
ncbi:MAG: protein kinase [Acidobacteria bacterium]|nr:protein kinase [Acidobacteriota bacterium]